MKTTVGGGRSECKEGELRHHLPKKPRPVKAVRQGIKGRPEKN